jgi:hypothetical protein
MRYGLFGIVALLVVAVILIRAMFPQTPGDPMSEGANRKDRDLEMTDRGDSKQTLGPHAPDKPQRTAGVSEHEDGG